MQKKCYRSLGILNLVRVKIQLRMSVRRAKERTGFFFRWFVLQECKCLHLQFPASEIPEGLVALGLWRIDSSNFLMYIPIVDTQSIFQLLKRCPEYRSVLKVFQNSDMFRNTCNWCNLSTVSSASAWRNKLGLKTQYIKGIL